MQCYLASGCEETCRRLPQGSLPGLCGLPGPQSETMLHAVIKFLIIIYWYYILGDHLQLVVFVFRLVIWWSRQLSLWNLIAKKIG